MNLQLQGFFLRMTLETVDTVSLCSMKKGPLIPGQTKSTTQGRRQMLEKCWNFNTVELL